MRNLAFISISVFLVSVCIFSTTASDFIKSERKYVANSKPMQHEADMSSLIPRLGDLPIPARPLGYSIGPSDAGVQLDVFVDFLCPDCAEAFPTLLSLASMYDLSLRITVHPFPLPYHRNAFLTAKAAGIVGQTGSAAFFSFAAVLLKNLDEFSGNRAENLTVTNVVDRLGDYASDWIKPEEFVRAMQNPKFEADARLAWKYGCSRAVYGTPTYHLNGVYISASSAWTTAHWKGIIDPLL